jgi:hypothetical protein
VVFGSGGGGNFAFNSDFFWGYGYDFGSGCVAFVSGGGVFGLQF